tara:strand:+ start:27649 stop:28104 length:456 start_codon:yes stop_codon:yes gene_type:complete
MTIKIRIAEQEDLITVVDMQEAHRLEVDAYESLSFNRELCMENMKLIIDHPLHLILVAYEEGSEDILAYCWLVSFQPHYSTDFYYSEAYTYIIPKRRKSSILARFIDKAKLISRYSGAKYLHFGSFSGNKQLSEAYHTRYARVGEVFNVQL